MYVVVVVFVFGLFVKNCDNLSYKQKINQKMIDSKNTIDVKLSISQIAYVYIYIYIYFKSIHQDIYMLHDTIHLLYLTAIFDVISSYHQHSVDVLHEHAVTTCSDYPCF